MWIIPLLLVIIGSEGFDGVINYLPPDLSPQCRQQVFHAIRSPLDCEDLSYEQQKNFALELTNCHLEELGQATFSIVCPRGDCIRHLTDHGVQCYTSFMQHVGQHCFRVTSDSYLRRYHKLSIDFKETARMASEKLFEAFQQQTKVTEDIQQQQSELQKRYSELENQEAVIKQKHSELQDVATKIEEGIKIQRAEFLEQSQKKDVAMEEKLNMLFQIMEITTSQLQPILGMESILVWFSFGLQYIHMISYCFFSFTVIWILTIPRCVNRSRWLLIQLSLLECLCQVLIRVMGKDHNPTELAVISGFVRNICRLLQCSFLIISFFRYCFAKEDTPQRDENAEAIATVKRLKEKTVLLQHLAEEREERLVRELQKYHEANKNILNESTRIQRKSELSVRRADVTDIQNDSPAKQKTYKNDYLSNQNESSDVGSIIVDDKFYAECEETSAAPMHPDDVHCTHDALSSDATSGELCSEDIRTSEDFSQNVIKKRRRKEREADSGIEPKPAKKSRTILLPWTKQCQ